MSRKSNKAAEVVLYIIAAALVVCCMSSLPEWASYLVKIMICGAMAYGAYKAVKKKQTARALVLFILALLFQPFIPIPLGKLVWTIIEITVILYLIYLLYSAVTESGKKTRRKTTKKSTKK